MLPEDWLEQLKAVYPKRDGTHVWSAVPRLVSQALASGAEWDRMFQGAKNYAIHCQRKGMVGTEWVMQARTFVGRDWHFDEWCDQDMRSPAEKAADRAREALLLRAAKAGFRAQIPGEPDYRYEEALKEAERALQPRAQPKVWAVK
jgi:hypothetical protein